MKAWIPILLPAVTLATTARAGATAGKIVSLSSIIDANIGSLLLYDDSNCTNTGGREALVVNDAEVSNCYDIVNQQGLAYPFQSAQCNDGGFGFTAKLFSAPGCAGNEVTVPIQEPGQPLPCATGNGVGFYSIQLVSE